MKTMRYLLGFAVLALFVGLSNQSVFGQTTSSFSIDLTGQPSTTTFPYGICYDGSQYVYVTIYASGQLARVNVNTLAVTFFDDNSASSGQDWYSALCHSNGKVYVNERDTGKMKIFDTSGSSFTTVPIPANIAGGVISYTSSYSTNPQDVTVNESCVSAGNHLYNFGFDSFGEVKFANNYVWQVIDYKYDFSANSETCGAVDVEFHGIARIDPSDNSVTRYAISGASNLRGIDVDSVDSTILWITDITTDKIFKFDTNTNTVTQTITLTAGSKARGITDDSTNLYVASNKVGDGVLSGKILQVLKSDGTISTIDTTAIVANGNSGVFEVDIARGFIMWSDESKNVGTINLSTVEKTKSVIADASSNHFGVLVGNTYWTSGRGSVIVTQTSFPSSSSSTDNTGGDDGRKYLGRPTMGLSHNTGNQLVDFGFFHNDNKWNISNNFYTPTDKISITTGVSNHFGLKTFVGDAEVIVGEISLVPEVGAFHKAEVRLESHFNFDKTLKDVQVFQKDNIIQSDIITSYQKSVDCFEDSGRNDCVYIGWDNVVFMEKPIFEKIALNVINDDRRYQITYLNDGFSFTGIDSLNSPMIKNAVVEKGQLESLTRIDKKLDLWQSESGIVYWQNDFGTFIRQSPYEVVLSLDEPVNVMERNHSDFGKLKEYAMDKAVLEFNSKDIQGKDKGFIKYAEPGMDHRELTMKKLTWNQ